MKDKKKFVWMRKHMVLMALVLAFSLIGLTQLSTTKVGASGISVDVDIEPDMLPLREERDGGTWITAYIKNFGSYDLQDINVSSVTLHIILNNVRVCNVSISKYSFQNEELIAKFDRAPVINYLFRNFLPNAIHMSPQAKRDILLEVTGKFYGGNTFQGSDTIKVFFTNP